MEQFITVELFGEQFRFKCDSDVPNAEKIVNFLIEELKKVENQNKIFKAQKFTKLLITTLNISNKYFELKLDYEKLQKHVSDRTAAIIDTIEKNNK